MARPIPDSIRLHQTPGEPARAIGVSGLALEELAAALAALPASVLVMNRARRILAHSGEAPPDGFLHRDWLDFVPARHHAFYEAQLRRVLDGGEVISFDVASEAEPQRQRWIRMRLAPLAVGGEIRGVVSLAMDIEHERAIERRADRIRATFDQVNEGMLVVDLSTGNIIECNEAGARLLQVPADELTDTAPSWLQLAPDHAARLGWGVLIDELCAGRTVRGRAILRDGQEAHLEFRATARQLDEANVAFVLCRDISEDLKEERARATQERLATVGSLAAGVAHEINNPLAYVIANVQYALDRITQWQASQNDPQSDLKRAQLKDALLEANEGARRVQRIVADLKTLARQGDDRVEAVDVEHALQWAVGVTMAEIRHRAKLVKNLQPVPPVRGDEARLGQVFVNVLLNAAQAIAPGNVTENEISLSTWSDDGRVWIEVADSGPGIPQENLTRIFDPFFTTKPRGVGTGLGLSICHEIVASMRGTLTAVNRKPHGARFIISLPALSPAQLRPLVAQRHTTQASEPVARSARVLIIDDEKLAAKALGRMLREHEVEIAEHAAVGLNLALSTEYDVIFCDLMMPEMSGMAVHAEIARVRPDLAKRMIFITGGTFTEDAHAFANTYADRCLFKPFDAALVKTTLDKLLRERPAPLTKARSHPV